MPAKPTQGRTALQRAAVTASLCVWGAAGAGCSTPAGVVGNGSGVACEYGYSYKRAVFAEGREGEPPAVIPSDGLPMDDLPAITMNVPSPREPKELELVTCLSKYSERVGGELSERAVQALQALAALPGILLRAVTVGL